MGKAELRAEICTDKLHESEPKIEVSAGIYKVDSRLNLK